MIRQSIFVLLIFTIFSHAHADTIKVLHTIDYHPDASIQHNIQTECTALGKKLSDFTKQFGDAYDVGIELVDTIDINASGKVLEVHIIDAISSGNGFIGHKKYVKIRGTLWENGEKVAEFTGGRYSGGGAFGGYKGSCAVLGRCVKALGKDIARWLKDPIDNASLGDG